MAQPSSRRPAPRRSRRPSAPRRTASGRRNPEHTTRRLAYVMAVVVIGVIAWLVASAKQTDGVERVDVPGGSLLAVAAPKDLPQQIIDYSGMTVSFNSETHEPNWVAWELLGSETTGLHTRESQFSVDENVKGCATPADYRRSGYDRGHMAPAGDMKWSRQSMRESFLMTNICPQAGELNRGAWQKLEEKCRQRAEVDSAVIIVCGPVFRKGEAVERIGETGVAVPRQFFKVVLSPYADPPVAIGFLMPNGPVVGGMQRCAVPVDSVEAVTGYDFFAALPDDVEGAVESQCNFARWSRSPKPRK